MHKVHGNIYNLAEENNGPVYVVASGGQLEVCRSGELEESTRPWRGEQGAGGKRVWLRGGTEEQIATVSVSA